MNKLFFGAVIAFNILIIIGVVYFAVLAVEEVKTKGLKQIANDIWCGQSVDDC